MTEPTDALAAQQPPGWIGRASLIEADREFNPSTFEAMVRLSEMLQKSPLLPKALKGDLGGTVLVLTQARQMEIPWTVGLKELYVVDNKVNPSARLLRSLVERHPDCEQFDIESADDGQATVLIQKRGWSEPRRLQYTMEHAKKAGLPGRNPNYATRPREMMVARATGLAANMYFPSVCLGLDVEEEPLDAAGSPRKAEPEKPKGIIATLLEKRLEAAEPTLPIQQEEVVDAVGVEEVTDGEADLPSDPLEAIAPEDAQFLMGYAEQQLGSVGQTFVEDWVRERTGGEHSDLHRLLAGDSDELVRAIAAAKAKPRRKA